MKKLLTISLFALFSVSASAITEKELFENEGFMNVYPVKTFNINGQRITLKYGITGGTACPALYYFESKGQTTNTFGTCSDLAKAKQSGNKIIVTMPGNTGNGRYVFENGRVTGKP